MGKKLPALNEQQWLNKFGANLKTLILSQGYSSTYDFWIKHPFVGDNIARSTIEQIVAGKKNPKATTINLLIHALGVEASELFNFK